MLAFFRKYIPVDFAITFAIWVLAVFTLGLIDFVNFEFDFGRVFTAEYLTDTVVLLFLGVMIFSVTLIKRHVKNKEEDESTQATEAQLEKELRDKDSSDLSTFVDGTNRERRIKAYKAELGTKLENAISDLVAKDTEAFRLWQDGTEEEKKANKKTNKLLVLQEQLDEDYIQRNADYLKADFSKITPNFITTGYNRAARPDDGLENPSEPFKQAVKDNYINFLLPLIFVMLILSFMMTPSQESNVVLLFVISIKVILLLFQQYSAKLYAPRFTKVTWVADTHFRYRLWSAYIKWKIDKKKKEREQNGRQPEREIRNTDEHEPSADSASTSEPEYSSLPTATSGNERS